MLGIVLNTTHLVFQSWEENDTIIAILWIWKLNKNIKYIAQDHTVSKVAKMKFKQVI